MDAPHICRSLLSPRRTPLRVTLRETTAVGGAAPGGVQGVEFVFGGDGEYLKVLN